MLMRAGELRLNAVDLGRRSVPASLSSETPVSRPWGIETLVHSEEAVDLSRAAAGLPLLWNHDPNRHLGMVANVRLDRGRLVGDLVFKPGEESDSVWADVRDGWLRDVSVAYQIHEWDPEVHPPEWRARRWELMEASIVTVPADVSVGINRQRNENMTKVDGTSASPLDGATVVFLEGERMRLAALREQSRRAVDLGVSGVEQIEGTAIREGWSGERYGSELLARISPTRPVIGPRADPGPARNPYDQAGEDAVEKFCRGAEQALSLRCNLLTPEEIKAARDNPFRTWSLRELAVEYFRVAENRRPADVASEVFKRSPVIAHSPGDFPSILANVAGKSLRMAYEENTGSLVWCPVIEVPDFKANYLVQLSAFSSLQEVPASGQVSQGTIGDKHETVTAKTYGRLLTLSRQLIVNDDANALARLPAAMGAAAGRVVADLVFAKLTGGIATTTMTEDSTYLFHANHANYIAAGAGAAISATTLGAARAAMAKQKDPNAMAYLNIRPAWLIVPEAQWATAMDYTLNQYDPAGTAGTLKKNPYSGMLTAISDPRLDADSATKWYLAASAGQIDTVVIAYVNGRREPQLVQEDSIGQDGTVYRVLHDVGVGVGDFRGLYLNAGA
jgi:HK97 family phage prohead protease